MRLSRNKTKPVYIFKMVNVPSGYVGTTTKIDFVGVFDCVPEVVKRSKNDDSKTESEIICKLTVPTGYHFKEGCMASFESAEKPDMKIISVAKYTNHCVCDCVSWK